MGEYGAGGSPQNALGTILGNRVSSTQDNDGGTFFKGGSPAITGNTFCIRGIGVGFFE